MNFNFRDGQAAEVLRVIQLNTLEDRSVHDKQQWDSAVQFVERSVIEKLEVTEQNLNNLVGPSRTQQWLRWTNATAEQKEHAAVKNELERLLFSERVIKLQSRILTAVLYLNLNLIESPSNSVV